MTETPDHDTTDVLIVGSGIAGCAATLAAARAGADVCLVTKAQRPDDASTDWAQGGISTTRGDPESLKADMLAASDDTADEDAIDVLLEEADDAIEDVLLETLEIEFDEGDDGFDYTREAGHSSRRILHVDAMTGTHILRPFLNYLDDHERVEIRQDTAALDLITHEGRIHGVLTDEAADGHPIFAGATILATGGIGELYSRSTNPADATGDGIAMAALAGAEVADLEYVQFHPTAYAGCEAQRDSRQSGGATEQDDPFLLSEALRGEGAVLRNGEGDRFMADYHPDAELAPRDVVARAVAHEREATGEVVLDVRTLEGEFESEFPAIARMCRDRGVKGAEIPVAPCEHFLCGGIDVDAFGRTSLDRLYAVGECSRTGVHGANRLASTSLLEGLVWGLRAGADATGHEPAVVEVPDLRNSDPDLPERFATEKAIRLKQTMDASLGLERDPDEIARASAVLRRLKGELDAYIRTRTARELYELRHACVTALLIARAASENPDSKGCHYVVADSSETVDHTHAY
ncbi:L-aspartate oxidase [Natronorubrum sulfidifaciens]|uniref:L-aspartate oxidase n=1 Tax=Natronorubrum sulfidifaciens JCM 14089 TaxID=1230460 RepID=L9WE90_9EURY|nr:FAD-dependent oxidoreductase [Natronorubrum sulfidifaciens]ELY47667.1 fumarate reductase/succinate dehydrogenase flavoprotein domain-containing protein [Natronorubrum sulfidifaciens JCM 14089]